VSKRLGSKYRPGPNKCPDWLKVKNPAAPARGGGLGAALNINFLDRGVVGYIRNPNRLTSKFPAGAPPFPR
jgi:hypothetical protein